MMLVPSLTAHKRPAAALTSNEADGACTDPRLFVRVALRNESIEDCEKKESGGVRFQGAHGCQEQSRRLSYPPLEQFAEGNIV